MTEAIFSEKRTRSQLTLPDNILQIPSRSPLKDARTALRNHTVTPDTCSSKKSSDVSDDELLLSPGKNEMNMKSSGNSKRSASPPPRDEYSSGPGSPSEGRELKRAKRDVTPLEENGCDMEDLGGIRSWRKQVVRGHTRTHSDPNVPRRSARKRSATTSKKPISTISASPPPTSFSPAATSPRKGRAHSVPLFPSNHDIPRIDFRNLPLSPRRSRSPSRSPSKDRELKQRIPSASFVVPPTLPTIQDEVINDMDIDRFETTSVPEEIEMELPVPGTPVVTHAAPIVRAPSPTAPPTRPISTIKSTLPEIPATPASQSLNRLIPMSPLTPLPETPLPSRFMSNGDAEDRFASNLGWGVAPPEEEFTSSQTLMPPPSTMRHSTSKSLLPRPSMAPPIVPPSKTTRPGAMGPPGLPITYKKPIVPTQSNAPAIPNKTLKSSAPKKDAFAVLMQKPLEKRGQLEREKAKSKQNVAKATPPLNIFPSTDKGKEPVAGSSKQPTVKMKDKMRPKTKSKPQKAPVLAPLSDEEEEEACLGPSRTMELETETEHEPEPETKPEPEKRVVEPLPPPRISPEAVQGPLVAPEDTTMEVVEDNRKDEPMAEPPVEKTTVAEVEPEVEIPVIRTTTPEVAVETPSVPPEDEAMHEPSQTSQEIQTESVQGENKEEGQSQPSPRPPSRTGARASKLPLGKKRQPISVAPASRVTRSVSSKKKDNETEGSTSRPSEKPTINSVPVPNKRTASGVIKKPARLVEPSLSQDLSMDVAEDKTLLPPGSPMKLGTPGRTPKQKTPLKTPTKFGYAKPASTPSPTKIARSSTVFSLKPSSSIGTRTFSMDYQVNMGASSSLSTLSNALEKLRMPAPSRPSTSMGFNRDAPSDDDGPGRSKDDGAVGRASLGMGRDDGGLKRASTLGANAFKVPTTNAAASSSKALTSTGKNLVQKPLTMFMPNKGGNAKTGTGAFLRGPGKTSVLGNKPVLFGVSGAQRRTVSKKTTLAMVVGSPVKGGDTNDGTLGEGNEDEDEDARTQVGYDSRDVFMAPASNATLVLEDLGTEASDKGKGKEKESSIKPPNASRRVSMISHALSQSLNAMPPPPPARGLMGPPATPPTAGRAAIRSTSSNYPSTSAGGSSPSQPSGIRSSARIAKTAPGALMKIKGGTDGHVASGKKGAAEPAPPPNPAVEALKVLKDCVIFVDVKTDNGEEAGSLFVEMLEGVGARVLTRVGQTCTHIVYKNGLTSTQSRYRLLRDPKPFVVGIAWVVECVEQRKRVDEADFLVDLEGVNVAGVHKRRRSMLPKLFATEFSLPCELDRDEGGDGDRSMDGSNSSMTMDDDLAPLERARRRKNIMVGPRP